jgi:hypothetical protein
MSPWLGRLKIQLIYASFAPRVDPCSTCGVIKELIIGGFFRFLFSAFPGFVRFVEEGKGRMVCGTLILVVVEDGDAGVVVGLCQVCGDACEFELTVISTLVLCSYCPFKTKF